jgi:hypothetical protein
LRKYRDYKYALYFDLYSRKVLNLNLNKQEQDTLRKIEESSSLTEIMRARNSVMERQMINNMYISNKINTTDQLFDRSNVGRLNLSVRLEITKISVVIMESTLMDMSNEINQILTANSKRDINQEKLNEKIKETIAKYVQHPAKNPSYMKSLHMASTLAEFLTNLSQINTKSAVFAISFVASKFKVAYNTNSRSEDNVNVSFGEVTMKDLDPNNTLHSKILNIREESTLTLTRSSHKASKSSLEAEQTHYKIVGRMGAIRLILGNTTFNRICTLL